MEKKINGKAKSTQERNLHAPIILALIYGERFRTIADRHQITPEHVRKIYHRNKEKIDAERAKYLDEVQRNYINALQNDVAATTSLLIDSGGLLRQAVEKLDKKLETIDPGSADFIETFNAAMALHNKIRALIINTGKLRHQDGR